MRILMVCPDLPAFSGYGSQSRKFCLIRELSRSHEVTVLCIVDETTEGKQGPLELFSRVHSIRKSAIMAHTLSGKILKGIRDSKHSFVTTARQVAPLFQPLPEQCLKFDLLFRKAMVHKLGRLLKLEKYDLVQVEHTYLAHWQEARPLQVPSLLVAHNVKKILFKRLAASASTALKKIRYTAEFIKFAFHERCWLPRFNHVAATSEVDRHQLINWIPSDRVSVVPNGVDTQYFKPSDKPVEAGTLLFFGRLDHPPNEEGLIFFSQAILPELRKLGYVQPLCVLGGSLACREIPTSLRTLAETGHLKLMGHVEDLRPYLAKACGVVVPLLSGSGTRVKILEAMSAGKAIVSTSVGTEGIEGQSGKHFMIADQPIEFAQKCAQILARSEQREQLGQAARFLVAQKYAWPVIAGQLEEAQRLAMHHWKTRNT
jgi:glycosyltransferase involved in cell wall biosynthesis